MMGIGVAGRALSGVEWAQGLLRNPFGLSSRAAATGPVVLQQIQRLQRLETCRYNGQVIVRGDTSGVFPAWLAGDRMLFVGQGEVVAGVDMGLLKPEDVVVHGTEVSVRLPATEILYSRIDNGQSRVFERTAGILTGPDPGLEGRVRQEAEDRVRLAAVESGLLESAGENARETLRGHLGLLGFSGVRFL